MARKLLGSQLNNSDLREQTKVLRRYHVKLSDARWWLGVLLSSGLTTYILLPSCFSNVHVIGVGGLRSPRPAQMTKPTRRRNGCHRLGQVLSRTVLSGCIQIDDALTPSQSRQTRIGGVRCFSQTAFLYVHCCFRVLHTTCVAVFVSLGPLQTSNPTHGSKSSHRRCQVLSNIV